MTQLSTIPIQHINDIVVERGYDAGDGNTIDVTKLAIPPVTPIQVNAQGAAVGRADISIVDGVLMADLTVQLEDCSYLYPAVGVKSNRHDGFRLEKIVLSSSPNIDPSIRTIGEQVG